MLLAADMYPCKPSWLRTMRADTVSFWLKPVGFFDRNPALDVAPTPEACDHHHSHHEDSDD